LAEATQKVANAIAMTVEELPIPKYSRFMVCFPSIPFVLLVLKRSFEQYGCQKTELPVSPRQKT
jgi:hypothetical protein